MVFLKEDGTLDIERIDQLPVEEHMKMLGEFTSKQMDYYMSTLPADGSNCPRNIIVDYTMEDEIKRGTGIDADEYLKKWREEYINNKKQ